MARNRFWLAVAPITYAMAQNLREKKGVDRRYHAQAIWRATTPATTYFVRGSGPQSLVIWSSDQCLNMGDCGGQERFEPLDGL
jgi:hypothetical protein